MAGPFNQARVHMSKLFNGEPRSYTRFNMEQDTNCDDMQVEIKASGEGEEEVVGSFTPPKRSYRKVFFVLLGFVVIFLSGYLGGYVMHRRPRAQGTACGSGQLDESEKGPNKLNIPESPEPFLDWSSITNMLKTRLADAPFESTLRDYFIKDHQAGSDEDEMLASKVLKQFIKLGMNPWYDTHFVKLQVPSRENPNKVVFGNEEIGRPEGYLAYSATGTKQGKVVYANYGEKTDLQELKNRGMNLMGSVALIRTGVISLAEKVANAAKFGVVAVLIYQEPFSTDIKLELFGHVHLGSGDPYTPGFPSFNHTQFPPSESSGLPTILAQSITAEMAIKIHERMGGKEAPKTFTGNLGVCNYTLGGEHDVSVTVNNLLVDTKITNVFGVIKGLVDPDQYVVLGAQRDAFSNGFSKSTVGTCLLVELSKAIVNMTNAGFKPKRSIVFASWTAGDYGNIGSTEWLEGYLTSLNRRAFTYISLDQTILGASKFKASASPLLHDLLTAALNEVEMPVSFNKASFLEPMKMEDAAYPFLAFSGIPSVSFRFVSDEAYPAYKYSGTSLDTEEKLNVTTGQRLPQFLVSAAHVAGQMALRLVHDRILRLDVTAYTKVIRMHVATIKKQLNAYSKNAVVSRGSSPLSTLWLSAAAGSFSRAASSLVLEIQQSDREDAKKCRSINDRIMRVEHNLLSPYVSPRDTPFRHIFFGSGTCTISSLLEHLKALRNQTEGSNGSLFRNQFALATWTIQGSANDLAGDIWSLDNQIE